MGINEMGHGAVRISEHSGNVHFWFPKHSKKGTFCFTEIQCSSLVTHMVQEMFPKHSKTFKLFDLSGT